MNINSPPTWNFSLQPLVICHCPHPIIPSFSSGFVDLPRKLPCLWFPTIIINSHFGFSTTVMVAIWDSSWASFFTVQRWPPFSLRRFTKAKTVSSYKMYVTLLILFVMQWIVSRFAMSCQYYPRRWNSFQVLEISTKLCPFAFKWLNPSTWYFVHAQNWVWPIPLQCT